MSTHEPTLAPDQDPFFVFDFTTVAGPGDGQRFTTYWEVEPLCRGPEPLPDWVVTDRAALDTELGILKTGKEADVFLLERAVEGDPGDQVLTPLRLPDGTALVVDRGWIPIDAGVPVTGEAAAPTGTVTVAGVLLPADALSVPTGTASPASAWSRRPPGT